MAHSNLRCFSLAAAMCAFWFGCSGDDDSASVAGTGGGNHDASAGAAGTAGDSGAAGTDAGNEAGADQGGSSGSDASTGIDGGGEGGSAGLDAGALDSATGGAGGFKGVCLPNHCASDADCEGCGDSRKTCDTVRHACIACNGTTLTCFHGQVCTEFGLCVPPDKTCPVDPSGVPNLTCASDKDCAACDSAHRACDTAKGKCVACTATNSGECLGSEFCNDATCTARCPATCTADAECAQCGSGGNAAHACLNHKCASCSPTVACAAGLTCVHGTCIVPCGLPGDNGASCTANADCGFCGGEPAGMPPYIWGCKLPFNGGDRGTCRPSAAGCEELGVEVVVLPEPYNEYTQLCSNDGNCSGVGIQYNVGKQIRDWMGSSELDLGFAKVPIGDASVTYGMNKCVSITVMNDKSCGFCGPCKEDKDCMPVALDPLLPELFKGEPLAHEATSVLVDQLFGNSPDHTLHYFCEPVGPGYGACAPCPNPFEGCEKGTAGDTGACDHDVCTSGTALAYACGWCATAVCLNDPFCCDSEWDQACVAAVEQYCPAGCGGPHACAHGPCEAGPALHRFCSACTSAVCKADMFCCNPTSGAWDARCVAAANGTAACATACAQGACGHSECVEGGPLVAACSSCATAVCAVNAFCCTTDWDTHCVQEAKQQPACGCN